MQLIRFISQYIYSKKIIQAIAILLVFYFCSIDLFAQEKKFHGDPDNSFAFARELAFNKERARAQDSLRMLLEYYPNYHDIREFLATTYSWDGDRPRARKEYNYILEIKPERKSTWVAAIKNELRSGQPQRALEMSQQALEIFPKNVEVLWQKSSSQLKMNKEEDAMHTLDLILDLDPKHEKAKQRWKKLVLKFSYNAAGIKSYTDLFSEVFDPMYLSTASYTRKTKYGSITGKFNLRQSFGDVGQQFEIDMYPRIMEGLYAYVNMGLGRTNLFPETRFGFDLNKSLPYSTEASLGFRNLNFASGKTVMIYTGSFGWYTGSYYLFVRSYNTPKDAGISKSGSINIRKYRSDADNYASFSLGVGYSPELEQSGKGDLDEIIQLKSQNVGLGYFFTTGNKMFLWGLTAKLIHRELSFAPGRYLWNYSLGFSGTVKFR